VTLISSKRNIFPGSRGEGSEVLQGGGGRFGQGGNQNCGKSHHENRDLTNAKRGSGGGVALSSENPKLPPAR